MSNKLILVLHSRCCHYAIQHDPDTGRSWCANCEKDVRVNPIHPDEPFEIGGLDIVFMDKEHMQGLPAEPTVQDEPMELLPGEDKYTICGLLKGMYWAETDEAKKQQLRTAVSYAKRMDRGLRHNKEKRDSELTALRDKIKAILDAQEE